MNENLGNIVLNDDSQRTKKIVNKDNSSLKDKNHPVLKKLEEKGGIIFLTLEWPQVSRHFFIQLTPWVE